MYLSLSLSPCWSLHSNDEKTNEIFKTTCKLSEEEKKRVRGQVMVMLVKKYGGARVKVAASSFYKQQRLRHLSLPSQRVYHQASVQLPGEVSTRRVRFLCRPDGRSQMPPVIQARYLEEAYEDEEDDDEEDDEFAALDQYPRQHMVHTLHGENDEARDRSKLIFALLVVPSLIALYSSHNKMNKGSDSNIDIDALKSGVFPGFAGGPGGNSFRSMMNAHNRHLPDFEDDDIAQMVASERDEKSSSQRYADKLMADYREYTCDRSMHSVVE